MHKCRFVNVCWMYVVIQRWYAVAWSVHGTLIHCVTIRKCQVLALHADMQS